MAKTTQAKLLDKFLEAAGQGSRESLAALRQADDLQTPLMGRPADKSDRPAALTKPPSLKSSAFTFRGNAFPSSSVKSSGGASVGSVVKTVFESGLGVVPLVGNLIGLFGGSSSARPRPKKYQMPLSLSFAADDNGGALTSVSFDQTGVPRSAANSGVALESAAAPAQSSANLREVDAQWFMDHSSEIAAAVRNAMLNSNSINDVVSDL